MNGGRREQNNFMIDGADNVDRGSNLTLLSFASVDSIAEVRVIRGQYDPEYRRAASGQVNVITRSGTSSLHGNIFEFWRNDILNARAFETKYPKPIANPPLRYHDFGGTIGGPVWIPKIYEQKNKTFFFFSEEVRRNIKYTNPTAEMPIEHIGSGNFGGWVRVLDIAPHLFGKEEEGFVFLFVDLGNPDRPADGATEIVVAEGRIGDRFRVLGFKGSGIEDVISPEFENVAVQAA